MYSIFQQLDNTRAVGEYCQCFHLPCFSHALLHAMHTHTLLYKLFSLTYCFVQHNQSSACGILLVPAVVDPCHNHGTFMLHSIAVMARAIVSAICVYLCRLVNAMLLIFCHFTAAVFSWDDSATGDRDADSRHLSNRLPGLPFPIPGPAQPRERCQCAAGPGNLH